MLQLFKKTGRPGSCDRDDKTVPDNISSNSSSSTNTVLCSSSSSNNALIIDDELSEDVIESRSRLSMNLIEIISDKTCLSYFIQFLEAKKALSLIKFYLDAESFKTATEISLPTITINRTKSTNITTSSSLLQSDTVSDDFYQLTNNSYRGERGGIGDGGGGGGEGGELSKSFSSEGYDSLSYTSYDVCDRISICSQSEINNLRLLTTIISSKTNEQDEESSEGIDNNGGVTTTVVAADHNINTTNSNNHNNNNNENNNNNKQAESVPELKTLCDLNIRKPLTDDEKSQIYAETNKQKSDTTPNTSTTITSSAKHFEKSNSIAATDAIRIYRKYLTLNSPHFIDIPATILSSISLALCGADNEDNSDSSNGGGCIGGGGDGGEGCKETNSSSFAITSNCFDEAQKYVLERLEKEYLNDFLGCSFYCKYCLDILLSPNLTLSDILHSESALFYFMEYLEQENQRDCLEFWIAGMNFRKHYNSQSLSVVDDNDKESKEEITNDAMILYEKYFSLQSPSPIKFSDRIRSHVEECICGDRYDGIIKCFDLPLRIIEKHLETKYFKNFLNSQLFTNYLTELRSKITIDQRIAVERKNSLRKYRSHRKTRSDCTAETIKGPRNSFISQQNTLLAMESSSLLSSSSSAGKHSINKSNKVTGATAADMQIDSRQLTNPDLLWHRNSTGGLSFGRVDSLGRYERDFDLGCPDEKWSLATGSSKIKNVVRKLVNLPEDKVQEEIAWQVAEMIVKDITSITLGGKNDVGNSS